MIEKFQGFMKSSVVIVVGLIIMLTPSILNNVFEVKHPNWIGWMCSVIGGLIILCCVEIRLK